MSSSAEQWLRAAISIVLPPVLLLSVSVRVSAQQACPEPELAHDFDNPTVAANDRRLWMEVNRILRLPSRQQALEIGHVYRDIFSVLHPRWYALDNWHVRPDGDLNYLKSRSGSGINSAYLNMDAQQASLALLAAHPQEAQPLIQRDLRSSNPEVIERGASAAGMMPAARFPDLYDDLKNVFLRGRECSEKALGQLFAYAGFPGRTADNRPTRLQELIPVLVARFQKDPRAYAGYLQNLLSVGPAPAELLAALDSDDSMLRDFASLALSSSTDSRLGPYVRMMLTDPNPGVRQHGFSIGFAGLRRRDVAYKDFKPALETLMRDPVWRLRLNALEAFAFSGDASCAPVLLDLFRKWAGRDPSVPDKDFSQLAVLAEAVAHRKFGFGVGKLPAHEDPANRLAIGKFSDWVTGQKP